MGTLMSQYGTPDKREAFVYKNRKGFYVDLFRKNYLFQITWTDKKQEVQ